MRNPGAMERVFIPRKVELVADAKSRLQKIGAQSFNPRETAYVETAVSLPETCIGKATVTEQIPARVTIEAQMETAGLLVLADRWDKGWRATLDGKEVSILIANHALRGVVIPSGAHRVVFRYQPASFTWGLRVAGVAAFIVICWFIAVWVRRPGQRA